MASIPHRPPRPRPTAAVLAFLAFLTAQVAAQQPDTPKFGQLPLAFVENRGQWDSPARYVARCASFVAHVADREWTLVVVPRSASRFMGTSAEVPGAAPADAERDRTGWAVRLSFEGACRDSRTEGERPLPGRYQYFIGPDPTRWHRDVPSWASIVHRGMYDGVDVRVRGQGRTFEYDLLLEPHADL